MRDNTIHQYFTNVVKYIQQVEQSARLGITGEAVRAQAFQQLLIKKGLITEAELTTEIGEVIRKANEPKPEEAKAEEAPKVELTVPTTEQVQAIAGNPPPPSDDMLKSEILKESDPGTKS